MVYISIDASGISHEWEDFNEMIKYHQGYPSNRWRWTMKRGRAPDRRRCECGPDAEFVGLKEFDGENAHSWAELAEMTPVCASCGLEEGKQVG